ADIGSEMVMARLYGMRAKCLQVGRHCRLRSFPRKREFRRRCVPSTTENTTLRGSAPLPTTELKLRQIAFGLGIADAKVPDKAAPVGDIETFSNGQRVQKGHPTRANAFRGRREPQRAYRGDDRIFDHFRHRPAPETPSCLRCAVGKYGQMTRGLFEAFKL